MMDYLEIEPPSCDGRCPNPAIINRHERVFVEQKFDGHRALLHLDKHFDRAYLTSRHISKKTGLFTENGANVPHITMEAADVATTKELEYTVLDGELIVPGYLFEAVQSVTGSLPAVAIDWQNKNQKAKLVVFDILFINGRDIRGLPYEDRKLHLESFLKDNSLEYIHSAVYYEVEAPEDIKLHYKSVIESGGEGLILKIPTASYGYGWTKMKKESTYDVVITGFDWGEGKFKCMIGAVRFGIYINGQLTEIGKCSGMSDGNVGWCSDIGIPQPNRTGSYIMALTNDQPEGSRAWFTNNRDKLIGRVIEVKGNGLTKHGAIRHPQFIRLRDDKNAEQCGPLKA